MNIKKFLGTNFLLCFYFFNASEKNLKIHHQLETKGAKLFCPLFDQIDQESRLDLLRSSVENSQGKSQDLYLEALAFEINNNKNKADKVAFQAYLVSQPYAKQLQDKSSLAFALNSLLNTSFLDQETRLMIEEELLLEIQRDPVSRSKGVSAKTVDSFTKILQNYISLCDKKKAETPVEKNKELTCRIMNEKTEAFDVMFSLIAEYNKKEREILLKKEEDLKLEKKKRELEKKMFFLSSDLEKKHEEKKGVIQKEFTEFFNGMIRLFDFQSRLINQFNTEKKSFLDTFLTFENVSRKEFYEELHSFSDKFSYKKIISNIKVNEENDLFNKILSFSEGLKQERVRKEKSIEKNNIFIGSSVIVFDGEHQKERGFLSISLLQDEGIDFSGLETSNLSYNRIVLKVLNFHISLNECLKCIILPKEDKVYFEVLRIGSSMKKDQGFVLQKLENLSVASGSVTKESSDVTTSLGSIARESSDTTTPLLLLNNEIDYFESLKSSQVDSFQKSEKSGSMTSESSSLTDPLPLPRFKSLFSDLGTL